MRIWELYCLVISTTNWFLCMLEFGCKLHGTERSYCMGWSIGIPVVSNYKPYETQYNSVWPTVIISPQMYLWWSGCFARKISGKAYQSERDRETTSLCHGSTLSRHHPLGKSLCRGCGTSTAIIEEIHWILILWCLKWLACSFKTCSECWKCWVWCQNLIKQKRVFQFQTSECRIWNSEEKWDYFNDAQRTFSTGHLHLLH